jgi:hypothetical protein
MDGDARWYLKSSKTADGQVRGNITDALFEIADALKAMTPPRTVEVPASSGKKYEPDMYTQSIQALRDELAKEAKKPGKSRDQFDPLSEL